MSLQPLKMEELIDYQGGQLSLAVNQALRKIYLDLDDRPRLNKARKLTVEMVFKPDEEENQLMGVEVDIQIKEAIPGKSMTTCYLVPDPAQGCLMFNADSPRANVPTLPFGDDEES